jgi:hypothetical protein
MIDVAAADGRRSTGRPEVGPRKPRTYLLLSKLVGLYGEVLEEGSGLTSNPPQRLCDVLLLMMMMIFEI